jgi:hypothetical protein
MRSTRRPGLALGVAAGALTIIGVLRRVASGLPAPPVGMWQVSQSGDGAGAKKDKKKSGGDSGDKKADKKKKGGGGDDKKAKKGK